MKGGISFAFAITIVLLSAIASGVENVEIRGAVAGTVNGASNLAFTSFTWNQQNFGGFFNDLKKDLGTETLKFVLSEGNKLSGESPYGVTYTT
ncbi:MAG: hypothetical protein MUP27_10145, partial [Desulfobacterales bacterium]|nr:hypothetical protein [Desulfobacterales bacterium]